MVPDPLFPRLERLPLVAAAAGAAVLGAVAAIRALRRHTAPATVRGARSALPRATVVVESDGPVREARSDVPW